MSSTTPPPDPAAARPAHDFEDSYNAPAPPPWDIGRPQAAFEKLAGGGALTGRVLDAGCGTGEHTLLAAAVGLEATGVDIAPSAIARAQAKATERHLHARFVVADALYLQELGQQFDTVLDCGLFHTFDDDNRSRYVESVTSIVSVGGRLHMLTFSEHQPGDWGPRRVTQQEIRESFASCWEIDSIEPALIDITIAPDGAQAWLVRAVRL